MKDTNEECEGRCKVYGECEGVYAAYTSTAMMAKGIGAFIIIAIKP